MTSLEAPIFPRLLAGVVLSFALFALQLASAENARASEGLTSGESASTSVPAGTKVFPVDSTVFVFSPGNWVGDTGRGGSQYRQTWNPGAYIRITWETQQGKVSPTLIFDTSTYDASLKPPVLACNLDGVWTSDLVCANEVSVAGLSGAGKHVLTVYLKRSEQMRRWGTPGVSGANIVRLCGLRVDSDSVPGEALPNKQWALIVGDSITEGNGAQELEGYSHLVGQALRTQGFEYGLSASGWSGWLHRGDNPPGDIPGYYTITDSVAGRGGKYDEADSRWNKIDASHSLLDERGHISAYGGIGQDPSLILINYGTNDAIHKTNDSDLNASIAQCLPALRAAAPAAHLVLIIPFGQYRARELRRAVADFVSAHPEDKKVSVIDLGQEAANALKVSGYWGGLHPNPRAHATFAAQITAKLISLLRE